jgi:hypothetical protein
MYAVHWKKLHYSIRDLPIYFTQETYDTNDVNCALWWKIWRKRRQQCIMTEDITQTKDILIGERESGLNETNLKMAALLIRAIGSQKICWIYVDNLLFLNAHTQKWQNCQRADIGHVLVEVEDTISFLLLNLTVFFITYVLPLD